MSSDFKKELAGKVVVVINVCLPVTAPFFFIIHSVVLILMASYHCRCGFTPQYRGLEELYQRYKDQGLVIIGFPCNQFGGQEPGSDEQIHQFCSRKYNVSFPIMSKVEVNPFLYALVAPPSYPAFWQVNGMRTSPVYQYLKSQHRSMCMARVKWNFEKVCVHVCFCSSINCSDLDRAVPRESSKDALWRDSAVWPRPAISKNTLLTCLVTRLNKYNETVLWPLKP